MTDGLEAMTRVRPLDAISRIRVPLLFVNGRFDHFRAEERLYLRAARRRPGLPPSWSQLAVVPGATHLVSLTRPEAFTGMLLDSIDAASPRSRATTSASADEAAG